MDDAAGFFERSHMESVDEAVCSTIADNHIGIENSYTLRCYLLSHECDIAIGINDFGKLHGLFVDLFNREPDGGA